MIVRLEGKGRARFCLQHSEDDGGRPNDLFWADVSVMSDQRVQPLQVLNRDGDVRGVMLDYVDGNRECLYRRLHSRAAWMRIVPSDYQNDEELARCSEYTITKGSPPCQ